MQKVLSSNYHFDLTYFYLGRAAEALGYPEPARLYYQRSVEASARDATRCKGKFQDWCDRLEFPRVAQERAAVLSTPQDRVATE